MRISSAAHASETTATRPSTLRGRADDALGTPRGERHAGDQHERRDRGKEIRIDDGVLGGRGLAPGPIRTAQSASYPVTSSQWRENCARGAR